MNTLYYGNNLEVMRKWVKDDSVDLCYIDPPFSTNGNFTITNGRASTISNSRNGNIAYSDKLTGMEFISFLKERLLLIKDLLSDEGSIYNFPA